MTAGRITAVDTVILWISGVTTIATTALIGKIVGVAVDCEIRCAAVGR